MQPRELRHRRDWRRDSHQVQHLVRDNAAFIPTDSLPVFDAGLCLSDGFATWSTTSSL